MRRRKNAKDLTPNEKKELIKAFKDLKAKQVTLPNNKKIKLYDTYVAIHLGVSQLEKNGTVLPGPQSDGGHQNAAFLPWHREFLRRVEEDLQKISGNPDLSIPYWDWADKASTLNKIFVPGFMGGTGTGAMDMGARKVAASHPFSKQKGWPIDPRVHLLNLSLPPSMVRSGDTLRRRLRNKNDLPEKALIDVLFEPQNDDYEKFRNAIENHPKMHGAMHYWVGGTMLSMSSPNDPIFMMNHANIDRLWALWQSYGHSGEAYYPGKTSSEPKGHKLTDNMWPWDGGQTGVQTRKDIWGLVPPTRDKVTPKKVLHTLTLDYGYVSWEQVKTTLDRALSAWRNINPQFPSQISNEKIVKARHGTNFGWGTPEELAASVAKGKRLIQPSKVGNGKAHETNLIRILKASVPSLGPQMPRGGPYLKKLKIAEIAHWIDSGMPK
jgi:tyrosinase